MTCEEKTGAERALREAVNAAFPAFLNELDASSTAMDFFHRRDARAMMLGIVKEEIQPPRCRSKATEEDVSQLLSGNKDIHQLALEILKRDKLVYVSAKNRYETIMELMKDPNLVKLLDWRIANAINSAKTKTVIVEFERGGQKASGKMRCSILGLKLSEETVGFETYDFVGNGKELLSRLGIAAGEKLLCSDITRISNNKQGILYLR